MVFGLAEGMNPDVARTMWSRARMDGEATNPEDLEDGQQDQDFIPDAAGYIVTLADGVATRLRFMRDPEEPGGYEAQLAISNRDFHNLTSDSVRKAMQKIFKYFPKPNQKIDCSPKA